MVEVVAEMENAISLLPRNSIEVLQTSLTWHTRFLVDTNCPGHLGQDAVAWDMVGWQFGMTGWEYLQAG